jgi:uncharacterized membrane protein YebE (DUF533 family)
MFDAKALLEQIAGAAQRPTSGPAAAAAPGEGGGGLADLLNQIAAAAQGAGQPAAGQTGSAGGGIGDLLRNVMGNGGQGGGAGGGLDQILGQLKDQAGKLGAGSSGDLMDTLGKVLGQATEGVKEGAGRVGDATGARDALTKAAGGRTPEELIAQVKDLIANNQLGAGAVLGGLGGLLLGTRTGRGVASSAVKLGALAMIGGLAYKAYQNHQAGRPLITGPQNAATSAAPAGSGFEPAAITNDGAIHIIRAMIAAAAADGRIDDREYARIVSSLGGGAADPEAKAFLEKELRAPSTAAQLAASVSTREEALQVYTAARIAIDSDSSSEAGFLAELAAALGIDPDLAAQVDATARSSAG